MAIKKVGNFIFPVGDKKLSQEDYYRALSKANSGFYPVGANGIWHGGIHVDDSVLSLVGRNDNKMKCMANGEVVAYRINEVYPKIIYDKNPPVKIPYSVSMEEGAYFSTGFTLVRHYFQMPKIEGENGEPPHITLYSLYMHQLDWYGYQQKEKAEKEKQREEDRKPICYPHYWTVKSGKAKPEKFDKVVVLKTPIPINEGDFVNIP